VAVPEEPRLEDPVVLEVWALVAQFIIPELLALLTLLAAEGQMAVLAALAAAS